MTKEYKSYIPKISLVREKSDYKKIKVSKSEDAAKYIFNLYSNDIDIFESSFVLLLNNAMNTIGWAKLSTGGVASTIVDVRLIAKFAIECLATSVIIAHNHPSGSIKPSSQDITITNNVKAGLKTLDINLIDHLILATDENNEMLFYSFTDSGQL